MQDRPRIGAEITDVDRVRFAAEVEGAVEPNAVDRNAVRTAVGSGSGEPVGLRLDEFLLDLWPRKHPVWLPVRLRECQLPADDLHHSSIEGERCGCQRVHFGGNAFVAARPAALVRDSARTFRTRWSQTNRIRRSKRAFRTRWSQTNTRSAYFVS